MSKGVQLSEGVLQDGNGTAVLPSALGTTGRSSGTASFANTSTGAQVIAHGLGAVPLKAAIAPQTLHGATAIALVSVDATNINILITGTVSGGPQLINWVASLADL